MNEFVVYYVHHTIWDDKNRSTWIFGTINILSGPCRYSSCSVSWEDVLMNRIRIIRWGLFALLIVTIGAYPLFESLYQHARQGNGSQQSWRSHFQTDWTQCDLSHAQLVARSAQVWSFGSGDCDFFGVVHVYNGSTWAEIPTENIFNYQVDQQGRLWRMGTISDDDHQAQTLYFDVLEGDTWSNQVTVQVADLDDRLERAGFALDQRARILVSFTRLPSEQAPTVWTTGVALYDGQTWTTYTASNTPALATERVVGRLFDGENQVWFLTESGRVIRFDGTWHDREVSTIGPVDRIAVDEHGDPWFATADGLVHSADGTQVIDWKVPLDLDGSQTLGFGTGLEELAFDTSGRAWLAVNVDFQVGYLLAFDGSNWTVMTYENSGLLKGPITNMAIDPAGHVWVVMPGGIAEFAPPAAGGLTNLPPGNLWSALRGTERYAIGLYWAIPFIILLFLVAFLFPVGKRLSNLGMGLGLLEMDMFLAVLLMVFLQFGFGFLTSELLILLIPVGLVGLVISIIARIITRRQDKRTRRPALVGIVLNAIGIALGVLTWFFLLYVVGY